MRLAHYEILPEQGGFYGSIPAQPGVWASAKSLESCRSELLSALEDWMFLGSETLFRGEALARSSKGSRGQFPA